MEKKAVTGLTVTENCLMVSLSLVPYTAANISRIFAKLASRNIMVDMISQTAPFHNTVNVSFTTLLDDKLAVHEVLDEIEKEMIDIGVAMDESLVKLSVVGIGMISQSGVAAKLFTLLADHGIEFQQVTTSEISISYTIFAKDKDLAVQVIAEAFEL